MIPFRLALSAGCIFAVSASAEPVIITSGEHDGFTRIVFEISTTADWQLQLGNQSAELQIHGKAIEFDAATVFDRISKARLTSVRSANIGDTAVFHMQLGCDCKVEAFEHLGEYIVIDIADSHIEAVQETETTRSTPYLGVPYARDRISSLDTNISWITPKPPSYTDSPHTVNFPADVSTVGMTVINSPDSLPNVAQNTETSDEPTASPEADASTEELLENVTAARTSLLEQLTMAAEQGLLEFTSQEMPPSQPEPPVIKDEITEEVVIVEETIPADTRQLSIQTVFDRDAGLSNSPPSEMILHCPSEKSLDVASWGSGSDFNAEIAAIRSNFLKEFDEPDLPEVQNLVQLYLRYGFGVEAASYLEEYKDEIPEYDLLIDLALVVDGLPSKPSGPLVDATGCNGLAGVWSIVGVHPKIPEQIGNVDSIVEAFATLPADLRRLLGARLASSFLNQDLGGISAKISEIVERAPGNHGADHDFSVASIKQSEGDSEMAREILGELVEQHSEMSAKALIRLAEMQLEHDQQIPVGMLLDLGASADEERGTNQGSQLRRLEVLWTARMGRKQAALELVKEEIQINPGSKDMMVDAANHVLMEMSPSEDPLQDYVEVVSRYQDFISEGQDGDPLRLEIGRELLVVGLPNLAIEMLLPLINRQNESGMILMAEAQLSMYRPERALEILRNVTGGVASSLRVQALLAQEDFEGAISELSGENAQGIKTVYPSWFKGDWAQASAHSNAAAEIRKNHLLADGVISEGTSQLPTHDLVSQDITLLEAQGILAESNDVSQALQETLRNN